MTGIVSRVYEDENHYHMVFKNCSSTKGNTTDDEERQRSGAAGGEFKLEKRDLYKERKEQEALRRAARLNEEAQKAGCPEEKALGASDDGSNEQQVHDFL